MTTILTAVAGLAIALVLIAIGGVFLAYLAVILDKILDKYY
ncbi:hypothetical protein [Exiguobacterium sp. KRL4]|nr:hypothetical protein [Exiguobacterium sp. KRL4]